ncbi:hypothetical protein ACI2LM_15690 [Paenibacillus lautus]|uniref:hypothetical protein n=1 Tax=Paenibacillus lautus TaxID=1401 RepID=UPI00384F1E26
MSLPENRFDYSTLDSVTADFLKSKEISMSKIVGQAYTEIGRELSEAREALAQHGYGCFEEWYTTLGFKKDQVYRWIGRHELIVANCEKRELIEQLPVSLAYELSRPSANPDAVKAVLDGEIHTHKEFKELEKSLKAAEKAAAESEQRAQQAEAERARAIQQHTKQQEKLQAHIAELEKRKGRSPEDEARLQQLSQSNVELTQTIHKLQDELLERNTAMEKRSHDLRKMKESLSKTSAYIVVDLSTALMHFRSIHDQREAIEVAERFWIELDETIAKKRSEWQELMENNISESEESHNERRTIGTVRGRQAVVIDADTLPGDDG